VHGAERQQAEQEAKERKASEDAAPPLNTQTPRQRSDAS
jgi:hypothetical protein